MTRPLRLDPDRFFPMDDRARDLARALFAEVEHLSIISPHAHTDPAWFATHAAASDAPALLVQPDHYLLRMPNSQGVPLEGLGINPLDGAPNPATPREIWRLFAAHYRLFRGTPSHAWLDHTFATIFDLEVRLEPETADHYFDAISEALTRPELRPRALFERFSLEVLATTDGALSVLDYHRAIHASGWSGQVISSFRPDEVTEPDRKTFAIDVEQRSAKPTYRIVGSRRRVLVASANPADARGVLADPAVHELSMLHVLNAAHSPLAYLGLPRRWCFVEQAIADAELCGFLDAMMAGEIASSLPGQDVATYWRANRRRLFRTGHRPSTGSDRPRWRIETARTHPPANHRRRARHAARLGAVVRAWLASEHRPMEAALDDPALFAESFRREPAVRAAVLEVTP